MVEPFVITRLLSPNLITKPGWALWDRATVRPTKISQSSVKPDDASKIKRLVV
jgi:hypothetical protein